MPAKVRLGCTLTENRSFLKAAEYLVLGIGYMISIRRICTLRAVEISKLKAAVINGRDFIGNLILEATVLLQINTGSAVLGNVQKSTDQSGIMFCSGSTPVSALTPLKPPRLL